VVERGEAVGPIDLRHPGGRSRRDPCRARVEAGYAGFSRVRIGRPPWNVVTVPEDSEMTTATAEVAAVMPAAAK
jgi:hypothetical protein